MLLEALKGQKIEEWEDEKSNDDEVSQSWFNHMVENRKYEDYTWQWEWESNPTTYVVRAMPYLNDLLLSQEVNKGHEVFLNKTLEIKGKIRVWEWEDGSCSVLINQNPYAWVQEFLGLNSDWKKAGIKIKNTELKWQGGKQMHWIALEVDQKGILMKELLSMLIMPQEEGLMGGKEWLPGVRSGIMKMGEVISKKELSPEGIEQFMIKGLQEKLKSKVNGWIKKYETITTKGEPISAVWHESIREFIYLSGCLPYRDVGIAAFSMFKPVLFKEMSSQEWRVAAESLNEMKIKNELKAEKIEGLCKTKELKQTLPMFLMRYHHEDRGPLAIAVKNVQDSKEYFKKEKEKTGIAARIKTEHPLKRRMKVIEDSMENSSEFAVQYYCALALCVAEYEMEEGFNNLDEMADFFMMAIPKLDEKVIEAMGWFARLAYDLGEGFVEKEAIVEAILKSVKRAPWEKERKSSSIENEWSSETWAIQMIKSKIEEYFKN